MTQLLAPAEIVEAAKPPNSSAGCLLFTSICCKHKVGVFALYLYVQEILKALVVRARSEFWYDTEHPA